MGESPHSGFQFGFATVGVERDHIILNGRNVTLMAAAGGIAGTDRIRQHWPRKPLHAEVAGNILTASQILILPSTVRCRRGQGNCKWLAGVAQFQCWAAPLHSFQTAFRTRELKEPAGN